MRKDSKILNRTLAIAIAAAMAVTSAPSMAFAGDVFEDGVVTEVVDAETAEVEAAEAETAEAEVIEEAAETDAVDAADTVEDSDAAAFGDGSEEIVSDEDTAETDLADAYDANTAAEDPGQVTNLYFDSEDKDMLRWYGLDKADYYQVVLELNGQLYSNYYADDIDAEKQYFDLSGAGWGTSYYRSFYAVTEDATTKEFTVSRDATTGEKIYAQPGTYSVKVRAVNWKSVAETVSTSGISYAYGAWSTAVSYTVEAVSAPQKIANLRVEDNYVKFDMESSDEAVMYAVDAAGTVYYENTPYFDSTKNAFVYDSSYASVASSTKSGSFSLGNANKLRAYQLDTATNTYKEVMNGTAYTYAFREGVTYTVRIATRNRDASGNYVYSDWSEISVTPKTEQPTKPETTKLSVDEDTGYLSWNTPSDEVYGYEIMISDGTSEYKVKGQNEYVPSRTWNATTLEFDYAEVVSYLDLGYCYYGSCRIADLVGDAYVIVNDEKTTAFKIEEGKTYSFAVRAYNTIATPVIDAYGRTSYSYEKQYSDWSNTVTYTETADTYATPAQVNGLQINSGVVTWNSVDNFDDCKNVKYEVAVTDDKGRSYYSEDTGSTGDQYNNYTTGNTFIGTIKYYTYYDSTTGEAKTGTTVSYDTYLYYYTMADGVLTKAEYPKDETYGTDENEYIRAFCEYGVTYSVKVRAIAKDANGNDLVGAWSEAATYKKTYVDTNESTTPATVTGLTLKTEDDEDTLDGAELHWNMVANASRYEIQIIDSDGNEYLSSLSKSTKTGLYEKEYSTIYEVDEKEKNENAVYYPSVSISDTSVTGLKAYVKTDGTAVYTVKDANGDEIKTFEGGKTYTIRIRAVNVDTTYDADSNVSNTDKVETYGEWSEAVTYTAPTIEAVTDLTYVRTKSYGSYSYYYFSYSAAVDPSYVYYQIAEDNQFSLASVVTSWSRVSSYEGSSYKLVISDSNLEAGKTYYVRAVSSTKGKPTKTDLEGKTIPVVSFTTAAARTPKNITNLKLDETAETEDEYVFTFDAVLESGDYYELKYSYTGTGNWISTGVSDTKLAKSSLNEGTIYVKATAYIYDEDNEKKYGADSNIVTLTYSEATSQISNLQLADRTSYAYEFTYSGTLRKGERIELEYSKTEDFATYDTKLTKTVYSDTESERLKVALAYTRLEPGTKYYIRARVENTDKDSDSTERYSAFTNTVTLTAIVPTVTVSEAVVTSKTIQLYLGSENQEFLTGFEVQRKSGSKWVAVGKTTDNTITDKKLKKNTTYKYRVRAYYYNTETRKTKNGSWTYYQATTWGASIKLKAVAKSKKSVKLSWNKVSGASGYEVYRIATDSYSTKIANGDSNYYQKAVLLKTLGSSKKTYIDKKLDKNLTYTYYVRAYKKVGSKKYYIESEKETVTIGFNATGFELETDVLKSNGKRKVTWSRVYGASGYLIEKYDTTTDEWVTYKKLGSSKTSYTFPANTEEDTITYRIRAYKGTEYSNAVEVEVDRFLAAPTNVKAKANASTGSVTVTWSAVSGADYYVVYRTTSSRSIYNSDTKETIPYSAYELTWYVADASKVSGYRALSMYDAEDVKEMASTTFVDQPITYTVDGVTSTEYEGPQKDVTYYYYVMAYKIGEGETTVSSKLKDYQYSGFSKAAKATVSSSISVKKPTIKKAKASSKKITVTWKKVTGADGYVVYRSTSKKKGYTAVKTITSGSTLKYVDKSVKKGTTYYYKIKAYKLNNAGLQKLSKYSKVKSAKAK